MTRRFALVAIPPVLAFWISSCFNANLPRNTVYGDSGGPDPDCYPVLLSTCPTANCFTYGGMCLEAGGMCQSGEGEFGCAPGMVSVGPGTCGDVCEGPGFACCAPVPGHDAGPADASCVDSCFGNPTPCGSCCTEGEGCYEFWPEGEGPVLYTCHDGHYELHPGSCETGDAGPDGTSEAASDAPGDVAMDGVQD